MYKHLGSCRNIYSSLQVSRSLSFTPSPKFLPFQLLHIISLSFVLSLPYCYIMPDVKENTQSHSSGCAVPHHVANTHTILDVEVLLRLTSVVLDVTTKHTLAQFQMQQHQTATSLHYIRCEIKMHTHSSKPCSWNKKAFFSVLNTPSFLVLKFSSMPLEESKYKTGEGTVVH